MEESEGISTVPGGDTPCVTAGDTRRVNPWGEVIEKGIMRNRLGSTLYKQKPRDLDEAKNLSE